MCELNSGCVQLSSALIFEWGLSDSEHCDDFLFTNAARHRTVQFTLMFQAVTGIHMLTDTDTRKR